MEKKINKDKGMHGCKLSKVKQKLVKKIYESGDSNCYNQFISFLLYGVIRMFKLYLQIVTTILH